MPFSLYSHSIKINSKNQSANILSSASNGFALSTIQILVFHAGYIYIVIQNLFYDLETGMTQSQLQFIHGFSSKHQNKSKSFDHASPLL